MPRRLTGGRLTLKRWQLNSYNKLITNLFNHEIYPIFTRSPGKQPSSFSSSNSSTFCIMDSANLTASGVDMSMSTKLQTNFTQYRPELEILWVLLTYSQFLPDKARYASPKLARVRGFPHIPMVTHILASLTLVLRYHTRYAITRVWPHPELLDLVLLATFSLTSWVLQAARSTMSYCSSPRRTGFQAAIIIQSVLFAASWIQGRDPTLFRASIKLLNWFASYRFVAQWITRIDPTLKPNFIMQQSAIVILSAVFATWEADVPGGAAGFLVLVAALMVVERTIAEAIYPSVSHA